MGTADIYYLTACDVELMLAEISVVDIVTEVLAMHAAGMVKAAPKAHLEWPASTEGSARTLNMPAWIGFSDAAIAGSKIISGNPDNRRRGLNRASGLVLLFDVQTARIRAIVNADRISALRTAAVTAIAVQRLCATEPETAAFIGCGTLADAHIEILVPRLHQLRRLLLFDREIARAAAFAERLTNSNYSKGIQVEIATSAQQAVAEASLTVTLTTTRTGYIQPRWLHPGSLLVNVSLDDLLPEVFFLADSLIVDDWELVIGDQNRILGKLHRVGLIAAAGAAGAPRTGKGRAVSASLGEVVSGERQIRTSSEDIIVVNPIGMGAHDVAIAAAVVEHARRAGVGVSIPY